MPREGTSDREIFEGFTAFGVETVWRPSRVAPVANTTARNENEGGDRGVRGKVA